MDPVLEGPADQAADPWGAGAAAAGPASDPWKSYGKHRHTQNINKIVNIMMMHFWLAIMFPKGSLDSFYCPSWFCDHLNTAFYLHFYSSFI